MKSRRRLNNAGSSRNWPERRAPQQWGRGLNYVNVIFCKEGFGAPNARGGYAASSLAIGDVSQNHKPQHSLVI